MDIGLKPSLAGWDINYKDGDYELDASLRTAVVLSLAINRRADPDEVDTFADPRGWWADPNAGSKLWLSFRDSIHDSTPVQVEAYIKEALQWMIDTGVAVDPIQVVVERVGINQISATITIQRIDRDEEVFIFNDLWAEVEGTAGFQPAIDIPSIIPRVVERNVLLVNGERILINGNELFIATS